MEKSNDPEIEQISPFASQIKNSSWMKKKLHLSRWMEKTVFLSSGTKVVDEWKNIMGVSEIEKKKEENGNREGLFSMTQGHSLISTFFYPLNQCHNTPVVVVLIFLVVNFTLLIIK